MNMVVVPSQGVDQAVEVVVETREIDPAIPHKKAAQCRRTASEHLK
jgi:hypothetical protein